MKQKIWIILSLVALAVFCAGCGADHKVYLEVEQTEAATGNTEVSAASASAAEGSGGSADGKESAAAADAQEAELAEADADCYVYVCGAVHTPGVYMLEAGSRIYQAVALAGGVTEEASLSSVNQAQAVCDGLMIYIPTEEEADGAAGITDAAQASHGAAGDMAQGAAGETAQISADGRVNLNTASEAELMTLSGIGASKAKSIVAYREVHGGFSSVEEIMNVDGIKDGLYNRIKDDIKVK